MTEEGTEKKGELMIPLFGKRALVSGRKDILLPKTALPA